jgi:multiple sugar transport system permease protein
VERYADTVPYLMGALDQEIRQAPGDVKEQLQDVKADLTELKDDVEGNPQVSERLDEVNELLNNFQPVPENLKYAEVDEELSLKTRQELERVESVIKGIDPDKLQKQDDLLGLVKGWQETIIEPNFVGFKYYLQFANSPRMWNALANTTVFTVISVFLELVLGLWIAVLINKQFRGRGIVRAAVLVPWALPTVIAALMWKFLFDGQNGVMAKIFAEIGLIPNMGVLLTTKFWSMFAVIFADVWKTTPVMALLLLAGLQTIPQSLYEAAEVDGASKTQQFFKITLPMLKSTILVALLFRTLDAFRVFDLIYVLTGGGPANSTETISVLAYKTMFAQLNFGAGSALSVVVFICVALISLVFV